tara:strand:+ start:263 stop:808 length:546 start_codon:yes stop_codon:yes gene_type:complete
MVFFCPDCLYSLGISKSTTLDNYEDDRKIISSINDVLKLITKVEDFSDYKANFPKKDLLKNKKYQKLSVKDKNNLNMLFVSKIYEADLNCSNCGYKKQINSTIKLYEFNVNDKANTIRSLEDNKLLCLDPTLPRTRDFTCKNSNCISHKDPSKKEAVFMKLPKSYNLTYVCNTCYYSWNLV